MEKKAQIQITSALIMLVVAVILTLIVGLGFLFSNSFKFYIIGGTIILVGLIYGLKSSDFNKQKTMITLVAILIGAVFILLPALGVIQTAYTPSSIPSNVKLAIPHYGAFKCQAVEDKLGQVIGVPTTGALISKSTVGFYTNGIKNIQISFTTSFWSTDWDTRIRYYICDTDGNNCGVAQYLTKQGIVDAGGKATFPITSIDFSTQSLKVFYERLPFYLVGGYQVSTGSQVSYDSSRYALLYYSTTNNPSGATVCSTSCDLNCPDIGVRQKLIFTPSNILGFGQSAPSFEYWETISYDLNTQGGATIYDSSLNRFCFSGVFYTATSTKMYDGSTIIYPDVNSKQQRICCPGATISSTYSNKICNSDGNSWSTIQKTDKITCISDASCPGAGNTICQNKQLSNGYSCTNKDTNGVGICSIASGASVSCCLSSDCNNDMVCDTSSHTCKGGSTNPICGNKIVEAGETCDDGNQIGGDGCSSICQIEITPPEPNQTCAWYQTSVTQSTTTYSWYDVFHLSPIPVVTNSCQTSQAVVWIIIAIVIIGALVFLIIYYNPRKSSRKFKRRSKR